MTFRSRRSRWTAVAALLVALALLAACGSGTGTLPGGSAAGPAPSIVTIATLKPNAAFAAELAARGSGAFDEVAEQFGTTVKFAEFGTAQDAVNAMLGGSAQMALGALSSFLVVQAAGKDVQAVFAAFVGGGGTIIGAKKYEQSRGTDLAEYAGGTFGYTREGSASQLAMKLAVGKAGLDWATTPHVAFGQPSAGLPLLQAGRLDIAAVDPSTAGKAIDSGQAYMVLNLNDPQTTGPILGQQLGTVYGFTTEFTKQYPQLSAALVGAFDKGLAAVKKDSADPQAVLKLFPPATQKALADGWDGAWRLSSPGVTATDGTLTDQAVKDSVSFGETAGQLTPEQGAAAAAVVNNMIGKG